MRENEGQVILYANFQGADPNEELTEINVRRSCFFPDKIGRNYITVRGFEMAHAACGWAPPTADQPALLGVNWSKGWIIEDNIIHGTRVSQNLYYDNDRDWMIEVTHGPCLVDNNIFASDYSIDNYAQGTAYVHNLFGGVMHKEAVLNRATPYHDPHSTRLAGAAVVYGGDDRIFQNIFLGGTELPYETKGLSGEFFNGTEGYEGCPGSIEEYIDRVKALPRGDLERHLETKQPAYISGNAYLKGAIGCSSETVRYISAPDPEFKIIEEGETVYLELTVEDGLLELPTTVIDTAALVVVRIVEEAYVTPEGEDIILDTDYFGAVRGTCPVTGPLECLQAGCNRIRVWG